MSTIKLPTDDEIAGAKGLAAEKGFGSAVLLIELGHPIEAAFVVAPFDRSGWAKYNDALHRDTVAAHGQVFAERCLWPALPDAYAVRTTFPATPSLVVRKLEEEAGWRPDDAIVRRLDPMAPPPGLDTKAAADLIQQHRGTMLWSVELAAIELSAVMKAPLADTWLAGIAADKDARAKGKDVIGAMEPYIFDAIAWPVGITAQLERRPAAIADLRRAFLHVGGEGARARSKRL
jgi:hypothetical protein